MQSFVTLALLFPLTAWAQLPRFVPLFDLPADMPFGPSPAWLQAVDDNLDRWDGGDLPSLPESNRLAEPFVFWSADGLLCAAESDDAELVSCRDPVRGVPAVQRKRPREPKLPQLTLTVGQATFSRDGSIAGGGEFASVAKLRCARSPLLDRRDYRYLRGPAGRLAVMVLEEDDVRATCAGLDAQCGAGFGPRYWRVLVNIPACPAP